MALLLIAAPAFAQLPADRLDEAVRALIAQHPSAGLSAGVSFHGAEWMQGYGFATLSPPRAASAKTSYRLASVTKTITGVAIMQLVEQGKIDLDAEIHTYLPRYPKKPWPITVRELLNHTSGTYHYRDQSKEGHFKRHFSTAQALAIFKDWPLAHEPGTRFLYTTYGYDLLGAIVEAVSGQSYSDYLQQHVFAPAGMTRSMVEDRAKADDDWASGYRVKNGRLVPSESIDISSRFAGGGTRSTVEDLLRYARALLAGKLVRPETWAQMQISGVTRDKRWVDYGLGFGVFPQHGHLVVSHLGGQPETTTLLVLLPHDELVIALATNVENQSDLLQEIADRIVELLLEDGARRRPLYADDPVDQVVLEGMNRVFSYGLARRDGWGGPLPEQGDAFAQVAALLSRERIAADPEAARKALINAHHPAAGAIDARAGAAMAAVLAEAFPDRRYAALGPIAFFSDYAEACTTRTCPAVLLKEELPWLRAQWEFAGAKLTSYRPERAADAHELSETLEPLLAHVAVRPDFTPELGRLARRWREQGREADALSALQLAARLEPFATEPKLLLADHALLLGDEDRAAELYEGAPHEALTKHAAALENTTHPRAELAAQWLKKRLSP